MIRPMGIEDLVTVESLEQDLFTHSWSYEDFKSELTQNPYASYWVLELPEGIIGYIGLWLTDAHAQITTLGVQRDHQRQGLAQELLDFAHAHCLSHSIEDITLEVRVSNLPAQALYTKNGYFIVSSRKHYYTQPDEDAYLMLKILKGARHENPSH